MPPNTKFDFAAFSDEAENRPEEEETTHGIDIDNAHSTVNKPNDVFVDDSYRGFDRSEQNVDAEGGGTGEMKRSCLNWDHHVDLEKGEKQTSAHLNQDDEVDRTMSSPRTRRFIRHKSSLLIKNEKEIGIDEERLSRFVHDAGDYAFGIIGVEVWEFDLDDGMLKMPKGGWWHHPRLNKSEELERLENKNLPNYLPTKPCMPGVGLSGSLWFESMGIKKMRRQASTGKSLTSLGSFVETHGLSALGQRNSAANLPSECQASSAIRWRDVKSLLADPDTPKDERLGLVYKAGFGLAAGIPFDIGGSKGIVIFLAREHADLGQLMSTENQAYMLRASELIGAVIASTDARRASVVFKKSMGSSACRKARRSFAADRKKSSNLSDGFSKSSPVNNQESVKLAEFRKKVGQRISTWMKKCRGGELQAPPGMSFRQATLTWIGCFVGLFVLSTMNEYALKLSGNDYFLLIGPFGALMTLQYGLTAAPASQPRNVIIGQAVAGAVSMSFTYIPETMLSVWLRRAVGPAFSIAAMLKLGVPHPPAGAHSVIYASGQYGWMFYFLVVLASIISVVPATLVNNLSEKRQYPTYWAKTSKTGFSAASPWKDLSATNPYHNCVDVSTTVSS